MVKKSKRVPLKIPKASSSSSNLEGPTTIGKKGPKKPKGIPDAGWALLNLTGGKADLSKGGNYPNTRKNVA